MNYSVFPSTGDGISKLGFGAMGFAEWSFQDGLSEQESIDSVLYSLERGVNFIDTARAYGPSENIIAKALERWDGKKPFIATKVNNVGPVGLFGMPDAVENAFPKGHITKSAEESLKALEMNTLDLLQLHLYWPNWGKEGYWMDELQALKESGKVRAIGVSVPDQRHDTVLPLVESGLIDSIQTVVNIFDPLALDCVVPICQANDVAVIARCVLDEGGLTGMLTKDTVFAQDDYRRDYFECVPRDFYISKVDALKTFIPEHAQTLAALALKFVTKHPGITTAITSMHITKFAEENIKAMAEPELSDEVFELLRTKHRWIRNFFDVKFW